MYFPLLERLLAAQNPLAQADRPHQLFADAPAPPSDMPGGMGGAPPASMSMGAPPPGAPPMNMPPPGPPGPGGPGGMGGGMGMPTPPPPPGSYPPPGK